jgi:hypothetical protein
MLHNECVAFVPVSFQCLAEPGRQGGRWMGLIPRICAQACGQVVALGVCPWDGAWIALKCGSGVTRRSGMPGAGQQGYLGSGGRDPFGPWRASGRHGLDIAGFLGCRSPPTEHMRERGAPALLTPSNRP